MRNHNGNATTAHERLGVAQGKEPDGRDVRAALQANGTAGFTSIRVHDLKHTFGRRLRAAGVTEEDRKVLLGHKNGSITSHSRQPNWAS